MHVIGGNRALVEEVDETITIVIGVILARGRHVLDDLAGSVESVLRLQSRPIRMVARPVGIDLPVLKRREGHGPRSRIVSIRAIAGTQSVARPVIVPTLPLVVAGVTRAFAIVVGPDSAAPSEHIVPLV